jgi:putative hemolysin
LSAAAFVRPVRLTPTLLAANSETHSFNELVEGRYVVRLARTIAEVDAALQLRFQIFTLECEQGLAQSFVKARDLDELDSSSDHLILIDRTNREVVGTCRFRTYEIAKTIQGFFSSRKFDLQTIPVDIIEKALEIDRACIVRSHRNSRAFLLLWKGLALYSFIHEKRYLFGCLSLSSQDPLTAGRMYDSLSNEGLLHPGIQIKPKPGFKCLWYRVGTAELRLVRPPLFRSGFRLGARLCGAPAIDRQLRTIDFPILLDVTQIEHRARRRLFKPPLHSI